MVKYTTPFPLVTVRKISGYVLDAIISAMSVTAMLTNIKRRLPM